MSGAGQRPVRAGRARPRVPHARSPLTVTPRTVPLPHIPLGGAWTGSGDNRPRAFATGSAEDVTVREYRRGDDLRRVHWRSSARVGELMVRREEQPWQSRATLFLDNRLRAHRGQGIASSLEAAVSAAASIAVHLSQRGFTVRLVTASGEDPASAWHYRDADLNTGPLLEALAVVQPVHQPRLDTGWLAEAGARRAHRRGLRRRRAQATCPVLRRMQPPRRLGAGDRPRRRRLGRPRRRPGGDAPSSSAQQGWRAVAAAARATGSTAVWQELGRTQRSRPAASCGGPPTGPARSRQASPMSRDAAAASPPTRWPLAAVAAATTWVALLVLARLQRRCPGRSSARCFVARRSSSPRPARSRAGARLPGAAARARPAAASSAMVVCAVRCSGSPAARSARPGTGCVDGVPGRRRRAPSRYAAPGARAACRRVAPAADRRRRWPACCSSTSSPARCAGCRWPGCRC